MIPECPSVKRIIQIINNLIVQKRTITSCTFQRRFHYKSNQQQTTPLTEQWKPTKEQQAGVISRVNEFFTDELNDLQEELHCPDEFIYNFLEEIRNRWSPESCHTKARQNKQQNPDVY